MKNVKFPILALSLVLLTTSCQKNDFSEEPATEVAPTTALTDADAAGWQTSTTWEVADQETFSVQYFTIEDAAITSEVADNGLVLLYKKSGQAVNALPFEESASTSTEGTESAAANYWYHQVTEGSLLISRDVYGKETPDVASAFKYFVITPDKLQALEADGYTTETLMNLKYADAAALLVDAQ